MSERFKLFWLGLFIILTVGILGYLLLLIRPSYGDGETEIRVRFTNIEGIAKGSQVTFAGKPVGEVAEVIELKNARLEPPGPDGNLYFFELILKVDSTVSVYSYDDIHFATTGLLGEKSVAILPKAPPPGAPPAENVTADILFGRSSDQLSSALNQVVDLSSSVQKTLALAHAMLLENREEFKETLVSLHNTSNALGILVSQANSLGVVDLLDETLENVNEFVVEALESKLIATLAETLEDLSDIAYKINHSEGTFNKLLDSDTLYRQLSETLCQTKRVMCDIGNYGLLFQYNKKWQRCRQRELNQPRCCPEG